MSSKNATIQNFFDNQTHHGNWIIIFGLSLYSVLIIFDIYLVISLVHYGIKTGKWNRHGQNRSSEMFNTGPIYSTLIFCSVFSFIYHILVVVYTTIGYHEDESTICEVLSDVRRFFYGLTIHSVSIFLWLRQRVFYTTYLPNAMFSKPVKFFSFVIIFLVFIGLIISQTFLFLPQDHTSSNQGCIYVPDDNDFSIGIYVGIGNIVLSQISMLFLFINALLKTKALNANDTWEVFFICCRSQSIEGNSERQQSNSATNSTDKIVRLIIKKTFFFAALSLLCDLGTVGFSLLVAKENQREDVTTILASIDVSANVMFLILSFISWKKMITSPFQSVSDSNKKSGTNS